MSLYQHISAGVRKDGPGLTPEGLSLPGAAAFSPGAHDHALLREGRKPDPEALAAALTRIEAAVNDVAGSSAARPDQIRALEDALDLSDAIVLVDAVVERMDALALDDWETVYDALSAVALSTDRPQSLKLAMALLGPFEEPETIPFFAKLARHPEFSLYATTALLNNSSPPARAELVALLDWTIGWAKVDAVERLLRADDLEIEEVLLTKALDRVDDLGGTIALGVAERCDLAGALDSREITRDTLGGACRILAQMAEDGSLDRYSRHDAAVRAFVSRLGQGPADIDLVWAAAAVQQWSEGRPGKRPRPPVIKRDARGRPKKSGPRVLDAMQETGAYLTRPDVVGEVVSGIVARDPARRQRAARLAAMGRMVEAYDVLRGALERYPGEDAVVLAAVGLAGAEELPQLRDQLMERIRPETRVGTPETQRVLDAGAGYTWQYIGLLEALERAPDEKSRALLKLAANDRDPRVREVAQRVLQAVGKT